MNSPTPCIHPFFDATTGTVTYIVFDQRNGSAAIIDSVLNYDESSGRISTESAELVLAFVATEGLNVEWILETHAHADHLSAAHFLREKIGGKIAIGQHIDQIQQIFKKSLQLEPEFVTDGSQFDHLFADNETFTIGKLSAKVIHVPGHTPADVAYQIGDAVFVGDTLFMPDVGTARCDFPGGDAQMLYHSIKKLLSLPEQTRLLMCHDYPTEGRAVQWQTTVLEQRKKNIHVNDSIDETTFIARRTARDATLGMPTLLLPSIYINIRAGELPQPNSDGAIYLKIPTQKKCQFGENN